MDGSDLDRAEGIFADALERPEAERAEFVRRACGDDAELARRVLRLLDADRGLTEGAFPSPVMWLPPDTLAPGQEIAQRYRLVAPIGEGGLGVVWRAEQLAPVERMVALKFVRHELGGRTVVARFAMERAALSLMEHPGIARIFDAGVAEGNRPFVAMELVDGAPITVACDERRLPLADRVRLLAEACRAAHHAHQKGIIHRDLKPTNILATEIDGRLVAKIIDFGIAKAIGGERTEHRAVTRVGQFIGTPAYMAPEQRMAGPAAIDVRADIFALGVVLHELLAGTIPSDGSAGSARAPNGRESRAGTTSHAPSATLRRLAPEVSLRVAEERRETPASLRRRLRGELDWIVAKATADEPERRYASASEFAADLDRWAAGEPVAAGPPGVAYRARTFVRRNAAGVAAGALVAIAIIAGLFGTSAGLLRARDAEAKERGLRDLAEAEALRAASNAYAAQIVAAEASLLVDDPGTAQRLLGAAAPHLRGWEWRRLAHRVDQASRVYEPGLGFLFAIDLAPDESSFLVSASGGDLAAIDVASGAILARVDTGLMTLVGLAISPTGTRVVAQGWLDHAHRLARYRIYEWPTLRPISAGDGIFRAGGIAPDGRVAAITDDLAPELRLVDLERGELRSSMALPKGLGAALATFTENGGEVVVWAQQGVDAARVAVEDGRLAPTTLRRFAVPPLDRGSFALGDSLFIGADPASGGAVIGRLEDWSSARRFSAPTNQGNLRDIVVAPNGRIAVASAEEGGTIRVHDLEADRTLAVLHGHTDRIVGGRFFSDSRRLITVGYDRTARLWDLGDAKDEFRVAPTDPTKRVGAVFHPTRPLVASGGWGEVQLFRTDTGELLWTRYLEARYVERLAFSPDGTRLAIAETNGRALLLDLDRGEIVVELPTIAAGHLGIAWDPLDRWIALAGGDGTLLLADPRDGREISRSRPTDGAITAIDRSSDGALLAIGTGGSLLAGDNWAQIVAGPGAQPSLLLIDAADGRVLDRVEAAEGIAALRFDRDGRRVYAGTADSTVVAFSVLPGPEGEPRLARDPSLRWELRGATPVESDARPSATSSVLGEIRSIDLDASGRRLLVGQRSGTVSVLAPGMSSVLTTMKVAAPIHACAIDERGDALLVASQIPCVAFETSRADDALAASRRHIAEVRSLVDPIVARLRVARAVRDRVIEATQDDPILREAALRYADARGEHLVLMASQTVERARDPLLDRDAHREALAWLDRIVALRPQDADALAHARAALHVRLGEPIAALATLSHLVDGRSDSAAIAALAVDGLARLDAGEPGAAVERLQAIEARIGAGEPLRGDAPWYLAELRRRCTRAP